MGHEHYRMKQSIDFAPINRVGLSLSILLPPPVRSASRKRRRSAPFSGARGLLIRFILRIQVRSGNVGLLARFVLRHAVHQILQLIVSRMVSQLNGTVLPSVTRNGSTAPRKENGAKMQALVARRRRRPLPLTPAKWRDIGLARTILRVALAPAGPAGGLARPSAEEESPCMQRQAAPAWGALSTDWQAEPG
jgi:hypothetical protein